MQNNQKTVSQDGSDVFQTRGFQKIDRAVNQSIAVVKQAKLGKRNVLATSWKRLNKNLLGGLQKGKMYVIAGRPGVGKSAFSNQLIFDVLDTNKAKKLIVLYWTFEMPGYQQVMRSASKDVKKQMSDLLSVESPLSDIDFKTYASKVQKYGNYPIYFNNIPRTMEYIMNTNEDLFNQHPSHTVINLFDHSRLIRGNEDTELRRLNTISKGCMWLQSKLGVINILLSQLNRNSIGQDAHVVMILNRPYDLYGITESYCGEDPQGLLACHMEKNRDGLLGMIGYEADMSTFNIKERN